MSWCALTWGFGCTGCGGVRGCGPVRGRAGGPRPYSRSPYGEPLLQLWATAAVPVENPYCSCRFNTCFVQIVSPDGRHLVSQPLDFTVARRVNIMVAADDTCRPFAPPIALPLHRSAGQHCLVLPLHCFRRPTGGGSLVGSRLPLPSWGGGELLLGLPWLPFVRQTALSPPARILATKEMTRTQHSRPDRPSLSVPC